MTSLWLDRRSVGAPTASPDDGGHPPEQVDDVVVGAGLTGLVTALLLARAGRSVAVVEARSVGAVTTGRTTAKISLLQATKLSRVRRHHSQQTMCDYVAANRAGMDWLLEFAEGAGVDVQRRDAVTFAADERQVGAARTEAVLAASTGLPVRWEGRWDGPLPNHGAALLPDQAQCDPMDLLEALVEALLDAGGTLHTGRRVTSVTLAGRPEVTLDDGTSVRAHESVLATGTPVVDRALHFARLTAQRSYLLAYTGIEDVGAMAISAGGPTRSLRDVPSRGDDDPPRVLVGGAGHVVGRVDSEAAGVEELRAWVRDTFPGAVETHLWSAQDYQPWDELPVVGTLPLGGGRVHVATGYDKWGMTNAVAAAHRIADTVLGRTGGTWPHTGIPSARSLLRVVGINLEVGSRLVTGWAARASGSDAPVCTHLGGVLHCNDVEDSWDCPLHGSRFGRDGAVLEGPATRPLG